MVMRLDHDRSLIYIYEEDERVNSTLRIPSYLLTYLAMKKKGKTQGIRAKVKVQ